MSRINLQSIAAKPSPCFENDNATLYHLRFFFFLQYTNVNILCYSACTTNHYRSASKNILQPQENNAKRSEFSWNPNAMEPQNVILSNSINGRKVLRSSANHAKQITMRWDMKFCGRSGVPPNIMYILGFEETFFRFVELQSLQMRGTMRWGMKFHGTCDPPNFSPPSSPTVSQLPFLRFVQHQWRCMWGKGEFLRMNTLEKLNVFGFVVVLQLGFC